MPKVVVYVPAAAWRRLEERGLDPAATVREFAKRGYEMNGPESSGAVVGNTAVSGSALRMGEEKKTAPPSASSRPERTAPDSHFKPDFKK